MCRALEVTRQGYRKHVESQNKPPKHADLLAKIQAILEEDEYNDTYGRERMHDALRLEGVKVSISTVRRICRKHGLQVKRKRPKGLTKEQKDAYKNDDLLKGDFTAEEPSKKLLSDITQLPTKDGTLYISSVFDCYDNYCIGLSMSDNMKTQLVKDSLKMATGVEKLAGAVFHTDRGSQYTSHDFRVLAAEVGIEQSMSLASAGCHGNAKCESMWARFKEEAIYHRYKTETMSMEAVKTLVFRYFMSYWNNRRICRAIGGMPPARKREAFYRYQKVAV
jgi:transposase InsO family protein